MPFVEMGDEDLQSRGFLAKIARRTNQLLEVIQGCAANTCDVQNARLSQMLQRAFHILPTRVLRKKRADDHFEASAGRPPVQRTIGLSQSAIKVAYCGGRRHN